ncbi:hypothetical protein D6851_08780 [Altericroceibacterium spongiae]|uniref:Glycerophosphoryl diester phosphodiesterase membrane domain-containing protein n=2 Tax=Altericroceibacterium spongiae TaxID=2320269 RepID=A0A420EJY6_9SPHN|nr:hypothetical protein D6851_08780 [Altericroceibacterium spongiae]
MSTAWRDAVSMLNANREVMLIVAGIFSFLPSLAASFLAPPMQIAPAGIGDTGEDADLIMQQLVQAYTDYWWVFVLMMLAQSVGFIALLALLRDTKRPTVGEALKIGLYGFIPYFVSYMLLCLALGLAIGIVATIFSLTGVMALVGLAFAVGFVAAIYVMVKCSLTPAIVAIEKVYNPIAMLVRSWKLTKGNSLRLFGFFVLIGVVYLVISMIVGMIVQALYIALGQASVAAQVVNGLVNGLVGAIATMVFVAVLAAVHHQLAGPSTEQVSETFE